VAIYDFGTGFSSLAYLATLPIDALKIGRSLVTDMMLSAQGVETNEQRRLLHSRGCNQMQGLLLSNSCPQPSLKRAFCRRRHSLDIVSMRESIHD
jgi:EAL domain-containing protein (putative c-di-GMP-specific phosphodiesterase class I)